MAKAAKKRCVEAKSRRGLAREVGRSESTVRKWISRRDWLFGDEPPWEVKRVKEWMGIYLKPDNAKPHREREKGGRARQQQASEMTSARTVAMTERGLLTKLRRLELEGSLHDVAECQRRRMEQIYAVKGQLLGLARSVSAELIGKDRRAIERILTERVTMMIEGFASGG